MTELLKLINDARLEAEKKSIEANAVAISNELYFSCIEKQLGMASYSIPIVCGLKAFCSYELPDDTAFAVYHADRLPMSQTEIEAELNRLREIERKYDKARRIIATPLIVEDIDCPGTLRPVKNTSKESVYHTVLKLQEVFDIPRRYPWQNRSRDAAEKALKGVE